MKIIKGNIWESGANWIIVTINSIISTNGLVMGAGIALQAKEKYPELPSFFAKCLAFNNGVPQLLFYELRDFWGDIPNNRYNRYIVGFPTKYHWKEKSDIGLIRRGLVQLQVKAAFGSKSIALPKLGCGCGGLDWESEVEPMMQMYLTDDKYTVYI